MDIGSALKLGKKNEESEEDKQIVLERADEVHEESVVIDGHVGTLFDILHSGKDIRQDSAGGHLDLRKLNEGRVRCVVMGAFNPDRLYPVRGVRAGLRYVDAFSSLQGLPGLRVALSSEDIDLAVDNNEVAVMLAFDGGEFLDGSIEALRMFHKLGLRMLALTWNERNLLADGVAEGISWGRLTHFGKQVVQECERLGIIVDAAHLSEAGFYDLVDVSKRPFVVSHANCHGLYKHPRNLTNSQLEALQASSGLIGISFNPEYLGPASGTLFERLVEHITYAVEVAGPEHVGLGSDFDGFPGVGPEPLTDASHLPELTHALLRKGLSGKVISGILGGNWLRVMRTVLG